MSEASSPLGDEALNPATLAKQLEELASRLGEIAPEGGDAATQKALQIGPDALKSVSDALRGMSPAFEASRPRAVAAQEQRLSTLLSCIAGGARELEEAGNRLAKEVHERANDVEAIAEMPPGKPLVARLQRVAADMEEAARDLGSCLDVAGEQVDRAGRRVTPPQGADEAAAEPALRDPKAGLYTRAALDERLQLAIATGPFRGPWGLLRIDIDELGGIHERYGRAAADALLVEIAEIVKERLEKACDNAFLARGKGEAFIAIVPGTLVEATRVGEAMREAVGASRWALNGAPDGSLVRTTVSVGVTVYTRGDAAASLLGRAEKAAGRARKEGGDRVVGLKP